MPGLDVLDQAILGQQSVDFAGALHVIDVGDLVDPLCRPRLFLGRGLKITTSPGSQVLCLADVDDHPGGVFHQVDAGRLREFTDFLGRFAEPQVSFETIGLGG